MDMHGITMNVAALHHDAATTQKPHTTCVDVLLFLTENLSECCCFFMSKGPTGTHYNPVVILKCPGISYIISDWMFLTNTYISAVKVLESDSSR